MTAREDILIAIAIVTIDWKQDTLLAKKKHRNG